jgi:hypothetical protein
MELIYRPIYKLLFRNNYTYKKLLNKMEIEVSVGEIVDKLTILQIKKENIEEESKLENILKEYEYLWRARWGKETDEQLKEEASRKIAKFREKIGKDLWQFF